MIVDDAHGLHEGVHGGGADEVEAHFAQGFAKRLRLLSLRERHRGFGRDLGRALFGGRLVRPDEFGECTFALRINQCADLLRVGNR